MVAACRTHLTDATTPILVAHLTGVNIIKLTPEVSTVYTYVLLKYRDVVDLKTDNRRIKDGKKAAH